MSGSRLLVAGCLRSTDWDYGKADAKRAFIGLSAFYPLAEGGAIEMIGSGEDDAGHFSFCEILFSTIFDAVRSAVR